MQYASTALLSHTFKLFTNKFIKSDFDISVVPMRVSIVTRRRNRHFTILDCSMWQATSEQRSAVAATISKQIKFMFFFCRERKNEIRNSKNEQAELGQSLPLHMRQWAFGGTTFKLNYIYNCVVLWFAVFIRHISLVIYFTCVRY